MESEAEESLIDNVDGSTVRLLGPDAPVVIRHRGTRGSNGGASTHSLNEADLQVSHFEMKCVFTYIFFNILLFSFAYFCSDYSCIFVIIKMCCCYISIVNTASIWVLYQQC